MVTNQLEKRLAMVPRAVSLNLGKGLTQKRARLSIDRHHAFLSTTAKTTHCERQLETSTRTETSRDETDYRLIAFAQRCTTNVASKKKRKKAVLAATKSARSFSEYYREMYGSRWDGDDGLCHALMDGPSCHAAMVNRLGNATPFQIADDMVPIPWVRYETNLNAMWIDQGAGRLPPPAISESSPLLNYYCLDPASLLPVMALNLPHHVEAESQPAKVLDMCAAPGGKTLAIMQSLFGNTEHGEQTLLSEKCDQHHIVVANEVSRSRRIRLENVLADYVPLPLQRSALILTEMDGTAFGSASFDAQNGLSFAYDTGSGAATDDDDGYTHVLCDVPCSGERHLLQSSSSLAEWNAGISRHLQKKQLSLLKAAVAACRPGGTIVYSTCSINRHENDGVVERLLHKRGDCVTVRHDALADLGLGERTEHGRMILPDHASCEGMGPMYTCVLSKGMESGPEKR